MAVPFVGLVMMEQNMEDREYKEIAQASRAKCLDLVYAAQTSHIGSLMSCADIMAVLFENFYFKKDKFILSAGWKAAMLYYHLWRKGRITQEQLDSYCKPGSDFIGLAEPIHPDIPFAGGSMGMGLAAGVGLAWSKKQRGEDGTVYVIESDGGMQVGINYEAVNFAMLHNLDNLMLIIDSNGFQAMGRTNDIGPLNVGIFHNFDHRKGWDVMYGMGHDYDDIELTITRNKEAGKIFKRPQVCIFHTIKGKGVSFMENNNLYHYKKLSSDEYKKALDELGYKIESEPRTIIIQKRQ